MKTVLFGNGLNYLSEDYITWKDLLDKIKGDNLFENGKLPNTMIYERSIIGNPISFDTLTQKEESIKKEIAQMLKGFGGNNYYKKLADINAENYLTTNYDYAFLTTFGDNNDISVCNKSTEGIYSIRRFWEVKENEKIKTKLWLIHGEIDNPPSIMLGLDHYCGSVAKIDAYVKGRYEFQHAKETIRVQPITEKLKKGEYDNVSWIELFFNSDIHIIGLGLDYSEIDLWWILNKRARFKLDNKTSNLIKNKIYFYTTSDDPDQKELLKTLNVENVEVKLSKTSAKYNKAYDEIFDLIKNTNR